MGGANDRQLGLPVMGRGSSLELRLRHLHSMQALQRYRRAWTVGQRSARGRRPVLPSPSRAPARMVPTPQRRRGDMCLPRSRAARWAVQAAGKTLHYAAGEEH